MYEFATRTVAADVGSHSSPRCCCPHPNQPKNSICAPKSWSWPATPAATTKRSASLLATFSWPSATMRSSTNCCVTSPSQRAEFYPTSTRCFSPRRPRQSSKKENEVHVRNPEIERGCVSPGCGVSYQRLLRSVVESRPLNQATRTNGNLSLSLPLCAFCRCL